MKLIDGKQLAANLRGEIAAGVAELKATKGVTPGLAVILVGDNPARMTARPGVTPFSAFSAATPAAISPRRFAASSFPSINFISSPPPRFRSTRCIGSSCR